MSVPVVICTKFNMKPYITKYMGAKFCAFVINIFLDMPYNRHSGRPF